MEHDQLRIRWAPKVRPEKLIRLYQRDAAGILDEELLNDVAWALHSRVRDVRRVASSRVVCPRCATEFAVRWRGEPPESVSACPTCGWTVTAEQYHRSWEHQDLNGHSEELTSYLEQFPRAKTLQERMLLIDRLVHGLHIAAKEGTSAGFAARNFLEGSRPRIVALLEQLAYGPSSTIDTDSRARWQMARDHYREGRECTGSHSGSLEPPERGD